jgi:hypothetical protein
MCQGKSGSDTSFKINSFNNKKTLPQYILHKDCDFLAVMHRVHNLVLDRDLHAVNGGPLVIEVFN